MRNKLISNLKVTSGIILSLVQFSVFADGTGSVPVLTPQTAIQQPQPQAPQSNNYGDGNNSYGNNPGNNMAPSGYYDDTNAAPMQSGGTVEYVDPGYIGDGGVIVAPGAGVVVGPGEIPAYDANGLRNGVYGNDVNPNVINQERQDQQNRYNAEQNQQQRVDQNRDEMQRGGEYRGGGFQRR